MTEQQISPTVNVTDVKGAAESNVTVKITGAPETKVSYMNRTFIPDSASITYQYTPGNEHEWTCIKVTVHGQRVLKPGPNGEQRLGQERHDVDWYDYSGKCLTDVVERDGSRTLPEWVSGLVRELRTSGGLTVY